MGLAGLGLKRLLAALVASPMVMLIGVVGLVERRNDLCGWLDPFPGVTCPPVSEPATDAAITALVVGLGVAVALAVLARGPRRQWLAAVTADHQPYQLPVTWGLLTFLSWTSVVAGGLLFALLTAAVRSSSGPVMATSTFPFIITGVLVAVVGLLWTTWRIRRLHAIANRRVGFALFVPTVASAGRVGTGAAAGSWGGGGSSGNGDGPGHPDRGRWDDGDGAGGGDGGSSGYPRDGGLYGDGPQHGTRSLADEQGGFYDDDHRDLRPPAEQPGNFYSSDPFGRDPE